MDSFSATTFPREGAQLPVMPVNRTSSSVLFAIPYHWSSDHDDAFYDLSNT